MSSSESTIRPGDEPITLINVFDVDPANQQQLLDVLIEATEQVMQHMTGFVSANLHTSLDGTRVVNYAQWRAKADFEAMLADPTAREHMSQASGLANSFTPHLYNVSSVHHHA